MKAGVFKVAVPIASALLTLLFLELGVRAIEGKFVVRNNLWHETSLYKAAYPVIYDPILGWAPRPGAAGENIWHTQVTILPDGVRANGQPLGPSADSGGPILAVGDSFTFGDEVGDADTWPAQLEARSGIPTVNGGVFGYGIDQSYLRALRLMKAYEPDIVILSFIPEDITRAELSERGDAPKPYFTLDRGALVLRNTPVPERREDPWAARIRRAKEIASSSELVHFLMSRLAPRFWFFRSLGDKRAHSDGAAVSCALINDLGQKAAEAGATFYALAQYQVGSYEKPKDLELVHDVLKCLDRGHVRVIDVYEALMAIRNKNVAGYDALFDQHMTAAGNRFIAEQMNAALAKRRIARVAPSASPIGHGSQPNLR